MSLVDYVDFSHLIRRSLAGLIVHGITHENTQMVKRGQEIAKTFGYEDYAKWLLDRSLLWYYMEKEKLSR